jgi:hypothetical protein
VLHADQAPIRSLRGSRRSGTLRASVRSRLWMHFDSTRRSAPPRSASTGTRACASARWSAAGARCAARGAGRAAGRPLVRRSSSAPTPTARS